MSNMSDTGGTNTPAASEPADPSPESPAGGGLLRLGSRLRIPRDVLVRLALLFAVLTVVKAAMLVVFQNHLFDTYWRVQLENIGWVHRLVFHLFWILLGLNLWRLAASQRDSPAGQVRKLNALVVALC